MVIDMGLYSIVMSSSDVSFGVVLNVLVGIYHGHCCRITSFDAFEQHANLIFFISIHG